MLGAETRGQKLATEGGLNWRSDSVHRLRQLAELHDWLAAARGGTGSVVLRTGDARICR